MEKPGAATPAAQMTARVAHGGPAPDELMRVLDQDVHQVRVGNSAPEAVPIFKDGKDPEVRFVRFADLSANVRHILDRCPEVEIRVDGARFEGARGFRSVDGWKSPVLQWIDERIG